ncbi:hypothetical protein ACWEQ3_01360 [Streptomyces mirabilis]
MAIRHREFVDKVTEWRAVETDGYYTIEVDYATDHGIKKTLVMPHGIADAMRMAIVSEFECMEPEVKKASFWASLRRKQRR